MPDRRNSQGQYRIVQLAMGRELGGASGVLLHFAQDMALRGHDVTVCTFRSGDVASDSKKLGLPTLVLSESRRGYFHTAVELTLAVPRMRALLKRLQPDIVHTHTYIPDIFGRPAAWWAQVPVVVTSVHTNLTKGMGMNGSGGIPGRNWMIPPLVRWTDRFTHQFYATSTDVQNELLARGIPSDRIHCLSNEIDCSRFVAFSGDLGTRARIRHELGFLPDHFIIGSSGRLERVKQFDVIIRALAALVPKIPEARLVLPGAGQEKDNLLSLARELGVEKRVVFPGWRSDMPEVLAALDVFVLASRTEASPLSLLEAMASRVACIVSQVGGLPDIIRHDGLGFKFPNRDIDMLCGHLLRLHAEPATRLAMAKAGQEHICANYNRANGAAVSFLLDDYRRLLERHR